MAEIASVAQSPATGEIVSLFLLDLTTVGGGFFYFVQGNKLDAKITFDGVEYTPADVEFDGLETTGQGALPTPVIRINNTDGVVQTMINTWGDLIGCILTRKRTFKRFLDGEADADPGAFFGPDVFTIDRKASENPIYVEWELSAAIDQEGKLLPGRPVIRDTCLWRYRAFNSGSGTFDYSKAQCPYAGSNYFDKNNLPTTAANDSCSRTLAGCQARFGEGSVLPFGGFPGVERTNS